MAIFKPRPVDERYMMENAELDITSARRAEKYRVSDRAIYIPAGFMWEYLPITCIREVHEAKRTVSAENCCVPFDQELPAIAVEYGETDKIYLELNSTKVAANLLSQLTQNLTK